MKDASQLAVDNSQEPAPQYRAFTRAGPVVSGIRNYLLCFGLLLTGIGGAFAPWLWREPVALQLTAPGLAEFVKFLPSVRTVQVEIQRLHYLLPLFVAMLFLPLFAANRELTLPRRLNWLMRLAVLPLSLAALSPVWTPTILLAAEFRLQTLLAGVAVGLAVIAPLLKWLPLKWLALLLTVGGAAAIALPYWQFTLVQADIAQTYHEPVSLGWGWWLTAASLAASIAGSLWSAFGQSQSLSKGC